VDLSDGEQKIILFWTKYYGSTSFDFGLGSRPFETAGCRVSNCKTTTDRLLLNKSHAIIFHSGNINVSDMPPVRFDHQRWIFYSFTSPVNLAPIPKFLKVFERIQIFWGYYITIVLFFKDKFNWTMTYRRDSDIIHRYPFGSLVASKTMRKSYGKTRTTANSVQRRIPHKKKLVAWITSICLTSVRRENYVRQLARHISVDIYGGCDISLTLSLSMRAFSLYL
jgi:alpha-1,3-fucosyltransferase